MELRSVSQLIRPLVRGAHQWQNITINGDERKPRLFFSSTQWILLFVSVAALFKLEKGISEDFIGYIISAFGISVSLFMSLLVSIFDKFENTEFKQSEQVEDEMIRLIQKKNFFKRFISITSYLVVLSILIIVLCCFSLLFDLSGIVEAETFTMSWDKIDWALTFKNGMLLIYRVTLNYFLLNYLFLTLFVTGSAYEYYMSEMNRRTVI